VPRDQADLIFLWDRPGFCFARFSPFRIRAPRWCRQRYRGIDVILSRRRPTKSPGRTRQKSFPTRCGSRPADPYPRQVRCGRTRPTRPKSMSRCVSSMLFVQDVDFHTVECASSTNAAVVTHASTLPNHQLIASLDVARRQMATRELWPVAMRWKSRSAIRQAVQMQAADLQIFPYPRRGRHGAGAVSADMFCRTTSLRGTNWAAALLILHE